jgi:hypothetical protein
MKHRFKFKKYARILFGELESNAGSGIQAYLHRNRNHHIQNRITVTFLIKFEVLNNFDQKKYILIQNEHAQKLLEINKYLFLR